MKKLLIKILGIQPEEFGPVNLLLTVSFFIGVFLVTFDVATSALFMDHKDLGQDRLSGGFILSGLMGAFVAYVFVNLQKRISFGFLVKSSFIFIFLYVAVLSYILEATKEGSPEQFINVIFFSFASLGPLNALAILSFYGIVTRAFNLKNQKRLTGTVDQGQMFATAIAFFTVPVLDNLLYFKEDVIHYLFVSAPAIIFALILYVIFERRYPSIELQKIQSLSKNEIVANVETFTKNPYIRWIGLIFLISGMAAIFVDYSFLVLSSRKYQNDPNGFALFLAYFGGVLTVFSLVLQVFIGDKLIETYGMKVALMIIPLLLAAFTIVCSLFGTFTINENGDFDESDAALLLVFIGLSKFFFQACRESFEEPIFKGFFLPIDKLIRHDVQAKIEGLFLQISVLIAGLLIFSVAGFFDLHHYSYILFFIFVAYGYIVLKLHAEYQSTLKSTLAAQKVKGGSEVKNQFSVTEALKAEIKSNEEDRVIHSLKLMEKMDPVTAESILIGFATDRNPEIRKYAIQRIQELKLISAEQLIRKASETDSSPVIKKLAQEALVYIDKTENVPLSGPKLASLVKSKDPQDRDFAAKILSRANDDQGVLHLLMLMRDSDPAVRITAILSAGKCRNSELWPLLIESLSSSVFGNAAAGAITMIGENSMPSLEAAFHRTGQSVQTQLHIVQIYGKIGGEHAIDLLWPKIDYPSKKIRIQVLHSLSNCGLRVVHDKAKSANNEKLIKIKQTLETAIGNAAWNVAALSEVGTEEAMRPVREALEEEIKSDHDLIFLLLSFMYDAESIRLVKENLESGTMEGTLYGIELLDVFLEDDIQPLLFPLLTDITQEERTEKLQNYFPRETLDSTQVLLHIVNRDYNNINRWTKACAIFGLAIAPGYKVTDDLIANLFNPDPLLRETAAWVIYYLDKNIYRTCLERLPEKIRKELDNVVTRSRESVELRMERVVRLKETPLFQKVPGVVLADLEEIMETIIVKKGETILKAGDNGVCPILVIREGEAGFYENEQLVRPTEPGEVLGKSAILETDYLPYSIIAHEDMKLYKVEKDRFFELMGNNYELVREFVGASEKKTIEKEEIDSIKS